MIAPLLAKLSAGAGTNGIKELLDVEITGHFGMSHGQVETASMAERLTAWWQTTGGRPTSTGRAAG